VGEVEADPQLNSHNKTATLNICPLGKDFEAHLSCEFVLDLVCAVRAATKDISRAIFISFTAATGILNRPIILLNYTGTCRDSDQNRSCKLRVPFAILFNEK
jgi:hypothetical protein